MSACDDIVLTGRKHPGVKCPRCWKRTGEGRLNFDGLCDACCEVTRDDYPAHESVPGIRAAYAAQRAQALPTNGAAGDVG